MRLVRFRLGDRAVLIPVEIVSGGKYALPVAAAFALAGGLGAHGYSMAGVRGNGLVGALMILGAFLASAILGPVLLPWLPGRAFSVKGAVLGCILVGVSMLFSGPFAAWLSITAWAFLIPTVASFVVMSFTGASTYTSLSGVKLEMRFAVPAQIGGAAVGCALWLTSLFVRGGPAP
jgi:hypothetical protein